MSEAMSDLKNLLQPHQLQALRFMRNQEGGGGSGGVVGDEMGLGKTLEAIACICCERTRRRRTTLVIVPAALVEQWTAELRHFWGACDLLIYDSKTARSLVGPGDFAGFDVVLVTYEKVRSDYGTLLRAPRGEDGDIVGEMLLAEVGWNRVILDEGHLVRNRKTRTYSSCLRVCKGALSRWIMTGTPVVNRPQDLVAYAAIVGGVDPLNQRAAIKHVKSIMLRRLKTDLGADGRPIVLMTSLTQRVVRVKFNGDELVGYRVLYRCILEIISTMLADRMQASEGEGDGSSGMTIIILQLLAHVRQYCDSPALLHNSNLVNAAIDADAGQDVIASIGKIVRAVKAYHADGAMSSKTTMIIERIRAVRLENPTTKIIVFSYYTSFLDLIGTALHTVGLDGFCRIDGTIPIGKRGAIIEHFGRPDTTDGESILLVSTSCCGVGLNLTMASHGILSEPWWNAASDAQAVARMHRMGQLKPVTVDRLIMKDSFEEVSTVPKNPLV
jgi:SNF2 family DNA or RNA helicase